ncbi:retrovirus-related pol polyprotein from transposon TNT 1-94 [Tanacetum coccineum]
MTKNDIFLDTKLAHLYLKDTRSDLPRYDRPIHPVLQIIWGIIHLFNIDYAERIWEEFIQSIQTFLTDRKNLTTASRGKKKTAHLLIPNVRFIEKDGRKIFGMPIPDALLTDEIKGAPYYDEYRKHLAKSKGGLVVKRSKPKSPLKLVDEPSDEVVLVEEPAYNKEETNLQRALELSLKEQGERTQGPTHPVVIREPDSRRIQPLLNVQGKGKEKVIDEQASHDLLTLQTPKKKSPAD